MGLKCLTFHQENSQRSFHGVKQTQTNKQTAWIGVHIHINAPYVQFCLAVLMLEFVLCLHIL